MRNEEAFGVVRFCHNMCAIETYFISYYLKKNLSVSQNSTINKETTGRYECQTMIFSDRFIILCLKFFI